VTVVLVSSRDYGYTFFVDALHVGMLGEETASSLVERAWTSERPNTKEGHE